MKKAWNTLHEIMRTIGILCICAILFCIIFQVVLRFFFGKNTSWCEEVSQLCYIALCFLGICLTERADAHIRLDMIFEWFPKAVTYLKDIGRILTAIYAGTIAYSEWLLRPAVATVKTKAAGIPLRYIHYIMMFGCIVWAIDAIIGFIMTIYCRRHGKEMEVYD